MSVSGSHFAELEINNVFVQTEVPSIRNINNCLMKLRMPHGGLQKLHEARCVAPLHGKL